MVQSCADDSTSNFVCRVNQHPGTNMTETADVVVASFANYSDVLVEKKTSYFFPLNIESIGLGITPKRKKTVFVAR